MQPDDADTALAALQDNAAELLSFAQCDLTEADTRCKIIDLLFKRVLGWQETAIRREDYADGSYADYVFESGNNRFVLEAKRTGIWFDMPAMPGLRARRDGILSKSTALAQALKQVTAYCRERSIPVGAVSNGLQLAVTLASPDLPEGYDTLLFDGLTAIENNFVALWNIFSPVTSAEEALTRYAEARGTLRPLPQYVRRLLDEYTLPDEVLSRNPMDAVLRPIIATYFSDLVDPSKLDVLREVYVDTERQIQYERQLMMLLEDRTPQLGVPVQPVRTTKKQAPGFAEAMAAAGGEGTVYLIVGGVGAGKTTFAYRFFHHLLTPELAERLIWVVVDFTRVTGETGDLGPFVDDSVLQQLREVHPHVDVDSFEVLQRIYEPEISLLRRGVLKPYYQADKSEFDKQVARYLGEWMNDKQGHIQRIVRYLAKTLGRALCVVFDNADQLDEDFQHRALILAFQKSRTWRCTGLLAVREETFWRHRQKPPFDAYHQTVYHITAPRLSNVLAKRLEVAKRDHGSEKVTIARGRGGQVSNIELGEFLEIIVASFLGNDDQNMLLIDALASNDVRAALDMFAVFLTSGHTNADEYIATFMKSGSYFVPFYQVLRSIALGDRRHYDSDKSPVVNLFELQEDGFYSHFTRIRLLRHLQERVSIQTPPVRGFVHVPALFQDFRHVTRDEESLRRVIDPLLGHGLVQAANGYRVQGDAADAVKITASGHYYLNTLISSFAYLELCAMDTPLKSRQAIERLESVVTQRMSREQVLRGRLQRVEILLDYLQEEERAESSAWERSGLSPFVVGPIIPEIAGIFATERSLIEGRVNRWGLRD